MRYFLLFLFVVLVLANICLMNDVRLYKSRISELEQDNVKLEESYDCLLESQPISRVWIRWEVLDVNDVITSITVPLYLTPKGEIIRLYPVKFR